MYTQMVKKNGRKIWKHTIHNLQAQVTKIDKYVLETDRQTNTYISSAEVLYIAIHLFFVKNMYFQDLL